MYTSRLSKSRIVRSLIFEQVSTKCYVLILCRDFFGSCEQIVMVIIVVIIIA